MSIFNTYFRSLVNQVPLDLRPDLAISQKAKIKRKIGILDENFQQTDMKLDRTWISLTILGLLLNIKKAWGCNMYHFFLCYNKRGRISTRVQKLFSYGVPSYWNPEMFSTYIWSRLYIYQVCYNPSDRQLFSEFWYGLSTVQ